MKTTTEINGVICRFLDSCGILYKTREDDIIVDKFALIDSSFGLVSHKGKEDVVFDEFGKMLQKHFDGTKYRITVLEEENFLKVVVYELDKLMLLTDYFKKNNFSPLWENCAILLFCDEVKRNFKKIPDFIAKIKKDTGFDVEIITINGTMIIS